MCASGKTTILPTSVAQPVSQLTVDQRLGRPKRYAVPFFSFRHKREVYHVLTCLSNRSPVVFTQGLPFVHRRLTYLLTCACRGEGEVYHHFFALSSPSFVIFQTNFGLDPGSTSASLTQSGGRSRSLSGFASFVKPQRF